MTTPIGAFGFDFAKSAKDVTGVGREGLADAVGRIVEGGVVIGDIGGSSRGGVGSGRAGLARKSGSEIVMDMFESAIDEADVVLSFARDASVDRMSEVAAPSGV